eukprot:15378-Heterococcus_DN1.PRE.2
MTHPVRSCVGLAPSEALHARGRPGACSACGIKQGKRGHCKYQSSIDTTASTASILCESTSDIAASAEELFANGDFAKNNPGEVTRPVGD